MNTTAADRAIVCTHCNKDCKPKGCGTGYATLGTAPNEHFVCYACAADIQRREMIERGEAYLYVTGTPTREADKITDWSGALSFPVVCYKTGRHNIGRTQTTAYFKGPDGAWWSARRIGDMDACRARRLSIATVRRERLA